ncbi:MAG: hypothetical protein WCA07_01420 [Gloeobacterales cyanobacterium]
MIISDLSVLEVVSEEKDVIGGLGNILSFQSNVAVVGQFAAAGAASTGGILSGNLSPAVATAANGSVIGQLNT